MKVAGKWDDDDGTTSWYDDHIISTIDYEENTTVHVKYDDGDTDDTVSWDNVRILDDLCDGWWPYIHIKYMF